MNTAPPGDIGHAPAIRKASVTFESMRSPGAITLRIIMRDETTQPHVEQAMTWLAEGSDPSDISAALRGLFVDQLILKCDAMGWSELSEEGKGDLRRWGEHAVIGHALRCLATGTTHVPERIRDRQRPVSVVGDGDDCAPAS